MAMCESGVEPSAVGDNKDGNAPVQVSTVGPRELEEKYKGFLTVKLDLDRPPIATAG